MLKVSPFKMLLLLKNYSTSPPFCPKWPKGYCCVVKLSNLAKSRFIYPWIACLSDCSFWTSRSPSILSRMIWNAFEGIIEDDKGRFLLAQLHELEGCPFAFASVSIGSPCAWSPSSSSPRWRTLIRAIVRALIAGGLGMRLMSWGISTPFARKSLMNRLGRISFALEVVLVSFAIMQKAWELISM